MLLEEFENTSAVIEPTDMAIRGGGEVCETMIFSFNGEIVDRVRQLPESREGGYLESINGRHPWYILERDGLRVAVMLAVIGAPMAVGHLEELKSCGFENFIVLGSCGCWISRLLRIRCSALRDEGTSYHYAPASEEISYDPALLLTMEKALDQAGIEHVRAKTWTTDAFYRETAAKVKRRLAAGAMVVDMEASAIMAWANFRQAKVYQFFYTADYVDHHKNEWDARREERTADSMTFFEVAMAIARKLESRSC
ncbi:TPA: nucleoside phosphorylase [Streptococcus suis]|nr:nucleoside phosphorylase [Streptococcus suis]HEL2356527.1 nucleoside phosphorylase [Streptococcus suis]HEL2735266.1 nucleoside phosphorylase [Streptococcus suis]HEM2670921.1 nucleoside phosphorylase [Streptococcus suis]HEM2713094.1 nucleoside phosphorylase [Streptococcus suis]